MRIINNIIELESKERGEYINITGEVKKKIRESGIKDGIVVLHEMHTTAALVIQESDTDLHKDTNDMFNELVPINKSYHHSYEGPANAAADCK